MTPNQLSVRHLRELGFTAEVVEQRIPGSKYARDLFGVLDIVAIRNGETWGVQATTADHVAHRRVKMQDSGMIPKLKEAGWLIVIHGWRKDGRLREEVLV